MPEDGLAFSRTGSKIPRWQMLQYLQSTGRRGTLLIAAILIPTAQQLINKQWERFILQYHRVHERTGLMSFRHSISSNSFFLQVSSLTRWSIFPLSLLYTLLRLTAWYLWEQGVAPMAAFPWTLLTTERGRILRAPQVSLLSFICSFNTLPCTRRVPGWNVACICV